MLSPGAPASSHNPFRSLDCGRKQTRMNRQIILRIQIILKLKFCDIIWQSGHLVHTFDKINWLCLCPMCSIFSILSAILHLGNVTFTQSDDPPRLEVGPPEVLSILSDLLKVWSETADLVLLQCTAYCYICNGHLKGPVKFQRKWKLNCVSVVCK